MRVMFASVELAARIERAECRMLSGVAATTLARVGNDRGFVTPIAGGVAIYTVEGSPLNKIAGLGFDGPVDTEGLGRIERDCFDNGAPVQVELSNLAEPSIGAMLSRRSYVLEGYENVLGRALPIDAPSTRVAEGIEVAESGHDELDAWIDTVVTAFLAPDTQGVESHESFDRDVLERIIRDMASARSGQRFSAKRSGAWAGGASMAIHEGVALLTGAATLPAHRRRGVQTALLSTRLAAASDAGCALATVTTQPGSKSHENAQRQGFELLYTRAVLVKSPP